MILAVTRYGFLVTVFYGKLQSDHPVQAEKPVDRSSPLEIARRVG